MATVNLQSTFLTLASNLSASVQVWVTAKPYTPSQAGGVQRYANGRYRAVTVAGTARQVDVTANLVPAATLATLEGWIGQTVLYRDPQGLKLYGVFYGLKETARMWPAVADVQFTLNEVTYSEAV